MNFFKRFFEWQNYVHYLLLSGGVFGIHELTDIWGIEMAAVNGGTIEWLWLFLFYALGLLITDTLIHGLFYILPEPLRWRD